MASDHNNSSCAFGSGELNKPFDFLLNPFVKINELLLQEVCVLYCI